MLIIKEIYYKRNYHLLYIKITIYLLCIQVYLFM